MQRNAAVDIARLARILQRVEALPMRSKKAAALRAEFERGMIGVARAGLRQAERVIAALNAQGRRLSLVDRRRYLRVWREPFGPRRSLEISVLATGDMWSVHALVKSVPRLTRRQRQTHALRQAFYARYLAAGRRAYRPRPGRLDAPDRIVLLVGELEADVNNGGFAQYLGNKGRRRAREALNALRAIGARVTARMLERALAPGSTDATWSALDARFVAGPEDLAVLTARRLELAA